MRAVRGFRWVKGQSRTGDQTFTGNQSYAHMHTYATKEQREGDFARAGAAPPQGGVARVGPRPPGILVLGESGIALPQTTG